MPERRHSPASSQKEDDDGQDALGAKLMKGQASSLAPY